MRLVLLFTLCASPASAVPDREVAVIEYTAGVAAAALTVPSTMAIANAIGKSTGDLSAALVPGILLMAVGPPFAVAGAEWGAARLAGGRARFHPALWAGVAVNLVAIVIGSLAGVWTDDPVSMSAFTVVDMLAMPAAVTLVMHYRRPPPPKEPARASLFEVRF